MRLPYLLLPVFVSLAVADSPGASQDQFFDSDGMRIRFVDRGSGEEVILIRGLTMSLDH